MSTDTQHVVVEQLRRSSLGPPPVFKSPSAPVRKKSRRRNPRIQCLHRRKQKASLAMIRSRSAWPTEKSSPPHFKVPSSMQCLRVLKKSGGFGNKWLLKGDLPAGVLDSKRPRSRILFVPLWIEQSARSEQH